MDFGKRVPTGSNDNRCTDFRNGDYKTRMEHQKLTRARFIFDWLFCDRRNYFNWCITVFSRL